MQPQTDSPRQTLALRTFVVLSRAHAAVTARAQADVARHGLTLAEFGILEALLHKGPLLLNELKSKILVSAGGITYLVDRLQERGLVERRRCDTDRRAYFAALTAEGERLIAAIFPEHARALESAFAGLSDEELETAGRLLRRMGLHAAATVQ